MRKTLSTLLISGLFAAAQPAAAVPDAAAEIAAIRAELAALTERLERLERAEVASDAPTRFAVTPAAFRFAPDPALSATQTSVVAATAVRFEGDVRYRHESIDEEAQRDRQRHRLRARFGVTADVGDRAQLGLRLATGGDDPVSANQTLDTGFDRKSIGVDRAFFEWQASERFVIAGGKIANPFFRPGNHHLIYDGDLNPEGLALRYERGDWFARYAGFWVEEREAADDSIMLGGQIGWRRTLASGVRVTAGASYYDYLESQGRAPFWNADPAGNRVDAAGNYASDFDLAELFAEVRFDVAERPLMLFADYVVNTEADAEDTGFAVGARYGEIAGPRTWRAAWAYQDLEADAVVGTFTDSDFAGGGTGGKGHVLELGYGLRGGLALGLRYFVNERGAAAGDERDYDRLQADVTFEF